MPRNSISLGKFFNIPIGLDYSWFLVFVLMTWTLAVNYFPSAIQGLATWGYVFLGAISAILLFGSVLLHELGHSLVALRYRIPVKSITLFIFGGVAQIGAEPPTASAEFWIALAGPVVSFALAGLFGLAQIAFSATTPLMVIARYLFYINGSLALFNLIPGFPLDGGRIFRAILWGVSGHYQQATRIAAQSGRAIAVIFILVGVWGALNGNLSSLWFAFIGWFLLNAATLELEKQKMHDLLIGHTAEQAMARNYSLIPTYLTLQDVTDRQVFGLGKRALLVEENGKIVGLLNPQDVQHIPNALRPLTTVDKIMLPIRQVNTLSPETDLWEALTLLGKDGLIQLPVIAGDRILGVINRESILGFIRGLKEAHS